MSFQINLFLITEIINLVKIIYKWDFVTEYKKTNYSWKTEEGLKTSN